VSPAPRNRTLTLSDAERQHYKTGLRQLNQPQAAETLQDVILHQDLFEVLPHLPGQFVDLLIADPPYNRAKTFNQARFSPQSLADYEAWLERWLVPLLPTLKPTASVYICGDWQSSTAIHRLLAQHCIVRNRITWEREKGRGAKRNWKNCAEDIWFATCSQDYTFNLEAVKLQRRVVAPYRQADGQPKDWQESAQGRFRLTHPSNLWTDLSVPFWSMTENTDHPTQKPEKLVAKLILASSQPGDLVLDPFVGSGTTAVVAKKLGRRYLGIEQDETFCCWAQKRLDLAAQDAAIQGYRQGQFWDRNSHWAQQAKPPNSG
jgi:site-specific DNA-methyltransferase (adenine-specific)